MAVHISNRWNPARACPIPSQNENSLSIACRDVPSSTGYARSRIAPHASLNPHSAPHATPTPARLDQSDRDKGDGRIFSSEMAVHIIAAPISA
jgi:hypothetical protein